MRTTTLAYLFPLLVAGCGGGDGLDDTATVSAALDSSDDTANESAVLLSATDGTQSATSANEAAAMGAAQARTWWLPSSCVTATAQLDVVTYRLTDCSGPYGLVHVSGSVVVTYAKTANGVHADAVANGLTINGATMDFTSHADYSVDGTAKRLVVATDGSGTGARGSATTRHGSYTLAWDDATACGALDGSWSTGVGGATWSTSIAGYAQCKGHCPSAGTLSHTGGRSGATVTVQFDGSADVRWSSSRGRSGTIVLFCSP